MRPALALLALAALAAEDRPAWTRMALPAPSPTVDTGLADRWRLAATTTVVPTRWTTTARLAPIAPAPASIARAALDTAWLDELRVRTLRETAEAAHAAFDEGGARDAWLQLARAFPHRAEGWRALDWLLYEHWQRSGGGSATVTLAGFARLIPALAAEPGWELLQAELHERAGEHAVAAARAQALLERAPGHPLAARARALLARSDAR